jgi:hypothetical protein
MDSGISCDKSWGPTSATSFEAAFGGTAFASRLSGSDEPIQITAIRFWAS